MSGRDFEGGLDAQQSSSVSAVNLFALAMDAGYAANFGPSRSDSCRLTFRPSLPNKDPRSQRA